jgi:hypothetical protein
MVRANGFKMAACTALVMAAGMLMSASAAVSDELVTIEKALYGPFGRQTFLIANGPGEWKKMMRQLEASGGLAVVPAPDAPEIDWSRYCVVLIAAGQTGYDVSLQLHPQGIGNVKLFSEYVPLGAQDGGEFLPYHLAMMTKHAWLPTQLWEDADVATALPLSGSEFSLAPLAALVQSWGAVKASYR